MTQDEFERTRKQRVDPKGNKMNERIKKLADEAQYYAEYTTTQGLEWLPAFKEKFAELIVKECSNVAWQHTPDTEELEYSHLIKDKILAHFGVEE